MRTYAADLFDDPVARAPGLRACGAEMSRAAFIVLIAAWSSALGGLFAVAMLVRLCG